MLVLVLVCVPLEKELIYSRRSVCELISVETVVMLLFGRNSVIKLIGRILDCGRVSCVARARL